MRFISKPAGLLLVLRFTQAATAQIVIKPGAPKPGKQKAISSSEISQTLTLAGQELKTGQKRTSVIQRIASPPAADGSITIIETVDSLADETTLPGGVTLKFDSKEGPKPQGTAVDFLIDVMAVMSKSQTTLVYDKNGKFTSAKTTAEGLEELEEPGKSLLKADLDPQVIQDRINSENDEYNQNAVKPGDIWNQKTTTDLGQGAKFSHTSTNKYIGMEEQDGVNLHKVTVGYSNVTFKQDAPTPGAPSIASTAMEVVDSGTTYYFDAAKQQVVNRVFHLHVKGDIKLTIQGMEIPAKIEISISTKSKFE
ncbi:MAG: hypothetical protein VX776_07825 [Planctomycetota bacterium]|nr:hypothetical protein [Planctomycetota bacterium]